MVTSLTAQPAADQAGLRAAQPHGALDREMDLLNQRRIDVGATSQEGERLTQLSKSSAQNSELHYWTWYEWLQRLAAEPTAA